jgi:CRISPR-associated protein Csh1
VIEAVRRIGDYIQDNNGGEDPLYKIIEDPDSNGKYKQVLVVALKEKDGNYSFSHVETQKFWEYTKYLYKGKQGNALDATPTSRITEVNKTFKKFLRWFDNYDNYPLSGEEKESIRRMGEAIKAEHDKIQADLQDKFSSRKAGESSIITLGFDDGVNIKYLSDIPIFRNVLLNKGSKGFSTKYGVESIGKNEMCSVCREVKAEVYSFAVPWSFHNYDKPGNISGGFEISESWKNTPICLNCATCLEAGKIYIEDKLDFSFYGFRYLLIPKLAIGGDIQEILTYLGAKDRKKEQKLNQEVEKRLTADESDILDIVAKSSDFVSTSLMFYKKDKSSYSILLLIEGILPSRLSRLFSIKESVDKRFKLYNDIALSESQKEKNHLVFNFGVVRRFFPSESAKGAFAKRSKNKTSDKMFMEMVNKIFGGTSIDYYLLIGFINERIREAFDEDHPTNVDTLYGFLLLHYL